MTVPAERAVSDYLEKLVQDEVGAEKCAKDPAYAVIRSVEPKDISHIKEIFIERGEPVDPVFPAYIDTSTMHPRWRKYALAALIAVKYSLYGADQYPLHYIQLVDDIVGSCQLDSLIGNI